MKQAKIPFWIAVLININIVIGSAFLVGAPEVSFLNGILAPFIWVFCGILLLPLVIVLAKLSRMYPTAGGLYIYSLKHLGNFWGFISGWGYYVGAAAGNAVVLHAFSQQFQSIDFLQNFLGKFHLSGINFDLILIILFTILNLLNIEFLENIQIGLTIIKSLPFLLVLAASPILFNLQNLTTTTPTLNNFTQTIPLALFAYIGIEACCAVADKINNGQKNASRVILISFGLIVLIYSTLQFAILGITGSTLINPFLSIIPQLTSNQSFITWGNNIINFAIMSSFLAGFYGMFYYNNWNLYAIANENSILFSNKLTKLNKNQAPWICVLVQSLLVAFFLLLTTNISYLMTMSDFGVTITYLLSAISFIVIFKKSYGYLTIASCILLILICINNLISAGMLYLGPFLITLFVGIAIHKINEYLKPKTLIPDNSKF